MGFTDSLKGLLDPKFAADPADIFGARAGEAANETTMQAAELSAQGQRDQLEYLKEVEKLPLELRDKFLPQLAGVFSGGQEQQDVIDSAQNSPLYQAIMGGQAVGEDAIMRNAGMTGGLRSGNVSADLTDYGSQLQNQALLESYNQQIQGMSGLARLPLNTNQVGSAMAAPSGTLSQGMIAGQQAIQNASQAGKQNAIGIGGALLAAFSDIRLKDNVKRIGRDNGHDIFSWTWNDKAAELGLSGSDAGVMAHLVNNYLPDAVSTSNNYLVVDYGRLGLTGVAH